MQVIGVAGQIANGKDVFADQLVKALNARYGQGWTRRAYADGLKQVFFDAFEVTREFAEEWKRKPESPEGFDMTVRQAFQFIGDGFRKIKPSVWIDWTFNHAPGNMVLSDVRYVNELKAVRDHNGINILIYRPGHLNDIDHPSEAQLRPLVEFFRKVDREGDVHDVAAAWGEEAPPGAQYIDLFIRNDSTILEFFGKVEGIVLPYLAQAWGGMPGMTFVAKGWGWEKWIVNNALYCGKILHFYKDKKCSYHYHKDKDETFYVQSGKLEVIFSGQDDINQASIAILKPGDSLHIPPGLRHQMRGIEETDMFEFSTHHEDSDSYRIIKGD